MMKLADIAGLDMQKELKKCARNIAMMCCVHVIHSKGIHIELRSKNTIVNDLEIQAINKAFYCHNHWISADASYLNNLDH